MATWLVTENIERVNYYTVEASTPEEAEELVNEGLVEPDGWNYLDWIVTKVKQQ